MVVHPAVCSVAVKVFNFAYGGLLTIALYSLVEELPSDRSSSVSKLRMVSSYRLISSGYTAATWSLVSLSVHPRVYQKLLEFI